MKKEILDEVESRKTSTYTNKSLSFFVCSVFTTILLIVITEYFFDLLLRIGGIFIVPITFVLIGLILNIVGLWYAFKSVRSNEVSSLKRNFTLIGNIEIK